MSSSVRVASLVVMLGARARCPLAVRCRFFSVVEASRGCFPMGRLAGML